MDFRHMLCVCVTSEHSIASVTKYICEASNSILIYFDVTEVQFWTTQRVNKSPFNELHCADLFIGKY